MSRAPRTLSTLLLAGLALASCTGNGRGRGPETTATPPDTTPEPEVRLETPDEDLNGLKFTLTEASKPAPDGAGAPLAEASKASEDRVQGLLDRVDPIERAERKAFALRAQSPPPPRAGEEVQQPWPPPEAPDVAPDVDAGDLRVVRFAPEGEVPFAPHVSVTFSQPMVAVTSQDEASKTVPVELDPTPAGSWRWLGTKTLLFDPDPRLPMATRYTATIPSGTSSALDVALDEDVSFSFETPPVTVKTEYPRGGSQRTDTLVVVGFDQRIDVKAILPFLSVEGGSDEVEVRLASEQRIEADDAVSALVERAEEGRIVVLEPVEALAPSTSYTVTLAEGAPSAEGPLLTTRAQSFGFRTYDPLKIIDQGCWEVTGGCNPDGQLWVRLNNALDDGAAEHISLDPAVDGAVITANGNFVNVRGALPARSKVDVLFGAELTDQFGQTLGKDDSRSFKIGPADPRLLGPGKPQVVLDPAGPPQVSLYVRNHDAIDVTLYRLTPDDLPKMVDWARQNQWRDDRSQPPVKATWSGTVDVEAEDDELVETPIDLSPHLVDGSGQFLVIAETPSRTPRNDRARLMTWVQRTRLGVTAFHDGDGLHAWVTDLQTGRPVEGASVRLLGSAQGAATTAATGLTTLGGYDSSARFPALVVEHEGDMAILSANEGWWHGGAWQDRPALSTPRWFVFDDRGMYKPGESARFKGWLRMYRNRPDGGLGPFEADEDTELTWSLRDAQGAEIDKGTTTLSATGAFDIEVPDLGESPNLGMATLQLKTLIDGIERSTAHRFQIQEFRRPEFEVTTSVDPRPYVLGGHAIVTAEAAYYSGEPLPAAQVQWQASASPGSWRPTGWREFVFGAWTPWWMLWRDPSSGNTRYERLASETGADGSHSVRLDFLAVQPPRPTSIDVQATVFDVNRQRWTSSSTLLVHPADRYVGLKLDRTFVERGKTLDLEAIVVDLDGEAVSGTEVTVAFERLVWKRENGQWTEVAEPGEGCTLTSADEPVACEITAEQGGSWRLTARIEDDEGRANETSRRVWVSGDSAARPERGVAQQDVILVPDTDEPQVGDTVEVLVQAPFWPAEGLVTLQQDGVLSTERLTLDGPTTTISVPITEQNVPTVHVAVDLVGETARTDDAGGPLPDAPKRVAYGHGQLTLKIPPETRTLAVDVAPERVEVRPGAETYVDVTVTGPDGNPVADTEVAVWMVDEAVLALSGYETPDPLALFYAERGAGVSTHHLRSRVVLVDPQALLQGSGSMGGIGDGIEADELQMEGLGAGGGGRSAGALRSRASSTGAAPPSPAPMAKAEFADSAVAANEPGGAAAASTPIAVRSDFRALAVFAPHQLTDSKGTVRIPVDLPDSLTRYRVMAVAAEPGVRFGSGDATLTARQPLMLRPSAPRFLNVGDRAAFPFVVQNPTDEDQDVILALRLDNAKVLDSVDQDVLTAPDLTQTGLVFTVPAEDRREVRIPVGVVDAGRLRFQAVVASKDATDAATDDLPVWTPATTEAFATYGSIDRGGIAQPIQAPRDAWPQYGGLEITTSSTQLQALTDALLYLNNYPFSCTEQISSRVLANAALRDVLDAFEADQLPSSEELEASVVEDLEILARRQRRSGGFSYWGRRDDVYPLPSLHAVHALVRARDKGWEGEPAVLQRGLQYAKQIERHIPSWYSENAKRTIRAYAVYVRHRAGDDDAGKARGLAKHGTDGLSLEAQAWLLPTLDATGQDATVQTFLRHWDNRAVETAAAATFQASYTDTNDYVLLHGSRRTDAVLLDSLLEVHPKHDLNEKIVRGLLGSRRKGRWSSTQENSFVLLALDRYFHVYEDVTPDFVAKAWLDDGFAGSETFEGRETKRSHLDVPMDWLQDGPDERTLTLAMEGEGRLYYRIGLRYAPKDLELPAADHGFAVERTYEAIDDDDDLSRDADGTWRVKAGARIRVRVTMVAESRRTMVALVDPMPGGFEPLNPALATTGEIPADPSASQRTPYWWWSRPWYSHQNLRDERAEAFTDLLWAGVHEYTYVAVATTPGRYVVPPAKAEEMYHPETFGRSAGDTFIIE